MKTLGLLAALCGAAAFGLAAGSAGAVSLSAKNLGEAADGGMVQLVHGCHADVRADRFGWHFHTPSCRRVNTAGPGPGYVTPGPVIVPRRRCMWVGPVWVC